MKFRQDTRQVGKFQILNSMNTSESSVNYFAKHQNDLVGIQPKDRRHHFYCIGKTGMGKSTLLENMLYSDIMNGHGVGLIDPHGDLSQRILSFIPANRINQVVYLNPADIDWPIAFNIMENSNREYEHLVASSLIAVFKKTWLDSWGPRLEHLLRNTILALLSCPNSTLLGADKILIDNKFRKKVIKRIQDPMVKSFWGEEFEKYPERFLREVISPLQNKLGALLNNRAIRNVIGQSKSTIDIEHIIDSKKIFIVNLSKGLIGEDASKLLGTVLVTKLQLAAMARAKREEKDRSGFYLYIDEFHNFATPSFVDILSEARKYHLSLFLTHQYLKQLDPDIKNAVLGNVGTIVTFRIGAEDAYELEKEFLPNYGWLDLVNLFPYEIYFKLMSNGKILRPYNAEALPPLPDHLKTGNENKIIEYPRLRYCRPREKVEKKIADWLENPTI